MMINGTFSDEIDYKTIVENIQNYLVFRISITTNLNERLAYLDIFDHLERIQLEAIRIRG